MEAPIYRIGCADPQKQEVADDDGRRPSWHGKALLVAAVLVAIFALGGIAAFVFKPKPAAIAECRTFKILADALAAPEQVCHLQLSLDDSRYDAAGLRSFRMGFSSFTQLKKFSISGIGAELLPRGLFLSPDIETLEINGATHVETVLPDIMRMKGLKKLTLNGDGLTELPPEIGGLTGLVWFAAIDNRLTELPPEIGGLENLEALVLYGNRIAELPEQLGNLHKMRCLRLADNAISNLPATCVASMTALIELDLGGNRLTSLPVAIGNLTSLERLKLDRNGLTSLPAGIGRLEKLKSLSANGNVLTELPPAISRLKRLMTLDLGDNRLTGVASDVLRLPALKLLILNGNALSSLPTGGAGQRLMFLDFTGNPMSIETQAAIRSDMTGVTVYFTEPNEIDRSMWNAVIVN